MRSLVQRIRIETGIEEKCPDGKGFEWGGEMSGKLGSGAEEVRH